MLNIFRISKGIAIFAFLLLSIGSIQNAHAQTWTASSWISYNNSANFPLFRKTFTVSKTVASATAYVCGLGLHEFRINGQKVGNNVQEPLWTNYSKKCFYVSYDVTSLLSQGNNAMGVMLGNGFYNNDATACGSRYYKYQGTFGPKKMIMQLLINYSDGTSATIVSDASWRVAPSPVTFSSVYGGEDYDARLEQAGWDTFGFTEGPGWVAATVCTGPGGTLTAQYGQPVQVRKIWTAGTPTALSGGAYEFDLKQNIAGVPVIQVRGPAGRTIRLSFREEFSIYTQSPNDNVYCQYTLKGSGTEVWSPRFFYYGFRYVKVQGASLDTTQTDVNVALNQTVTASSSYVGGGWSAASAVDGQTASNSSSMGWSSNNSLTTNHTEWIIVNLGSIYQVSDVDLYPRNDNGNIGYGFPVNFTIQVSIDSVSWTTVTTQAGYPLPATGAVQSFTFSVQNAKYVKVQGTSLRSNPNDANAYRMQFAEIGVISRNTTLPVILSVQGNEQNSVTRTGSFSCSDTLWNKIHYIIDKAIEGNMQAVATDCPHREKLGWLEESHLVGPSIMYNYGVSEFYRKILDDMHEAQLANGMVPDIAPEYTVFSGGFRDSPEWGSAIVLGSWLAYQFYGDIHFLQDRYTVMKAYVNYLSSRASGNLINFGLSDWYGIDVAAITQLVASSIYYYDVTILQQAATLLGNTADAATWSTLAANIKTAFNNTLFTASTNTYLTGNQTTCGMPLALGLVPDNNKAAVLARLVARVQSDGYRMQVGEIGFRFVLKALSDNNRSDVIAQIASQTTSPSYGYLANSGRTTLSESMSGDPASSQFHMMYGQIEEWFYYAALGIAPNSPGYAEIRFKPEVAGVISNAAGYVQTKNGRASSSWTYANRIFDQDIVIPAGSTGLVYLPAVGFGIDSAIAYAGTTVIWRNRAVAGSVSGVTYDTTVNNYLVWNVAAGGYHFRIGPPGTPPPPISAIPSSKAPGPGTKSPVSRMAVLKNKTLYLHGDFRDIRRIEIRDILGRTLFAASLREGTSTLRLSKTLGRGIRFVQCIGEYQSYTVPVNIE